MNRFLLTPMLLVLALSLGCGKKAYDNPIANNSAQPDKILFDQSINQLEKHKYQIARLTLQTLINTYPDSEYLAKAKLAIADTWYREGTSHALAQAEAEYKDFITFFPSMEEAAESQKKICEIHYEQMVKPDRDNTHAVKADHECRQLLLQWPNSVFRGETEQLLRNAQEVIAEAEFRVGTFYAQKGSFRAGANRLQAMADHYPLYSRNDEALWTLGETYQSMGEQFTEQMVDAYTRIVRDYPASPWVEDAKSKLAELNRSVPAADSEREKIHRYNLENRTYKGMLSKTFGIFGGSPDIKMAAKLGDPVMTSLMPSTPPGIRPSAAGATSPSADVTVETIEGPSALDTEPDARQSRQNDPEE